LARLFFLKIEDNGIPALLIFFFGALRATAFWFWHMPQTAGWLRLILQVERLFHRRLKTNFSQQWLDEASLQNRHLSAHRGCISVWHLGHIKPFSRITMQVWQKSSRILPRFWGSFMSEMTIWSMRAKTSAVLSIASRLPPLSRPT
jgi:hypothetical protein